MTSSPENSVSATRGTSSSIGLQARWPLFRRPVVWIGGALLLVIVTLALLLEPESGGSPAAPADAQDPSRERMRVTVATAGPRTFDLGLDVTGLLAARDEVSIGAAVSGQRISAVLVDVGDIVAAGQLLARLETDILTAQARQAEAAVARARATVAQAQASDAEAQANLRRVEALAGSSVVSAQQADERRAGALNAAAAVDAARAELAGAQAQLTQSRAELARTEIRAPSAGVIATRSARVGALADGTEPLFRLIVGGEVEFLAEAPERALPELREGQRVVLRVNGVEHPVEGRVRVVGPTIDPLSRLAVIRIALPGTDSLRAGAFARGRVTLGEHRFDITAPETALSHRMGDRASVMVVDRTGAVATRAVRIGRSHDGGVEVLEGLRPGERIVRTAGAFLRDGDRIDPVPAPVAAPGAAR